MTRKWLGSPLFISHEDRPFIRGITLFRGLTITMVINHLLFGMILQVSKKIATKIKLEKLPSWWFFTNPYEKYARQIGSFPQVGVKRKK